MRPLFPLLFLLSTAAPLLSGETPEAPVVLAETNAATLYRSAFEAMRPFTEEEQILLANTTGKMGLANRSPFPAAEAAALLNDFAPALALFAKASQQPHCDWEIDLTQGPHTSFDHLTPFLRLSRLAALQVRRCIHEDQFHTARETLREILDANHHITKRTPFLLEFLVQHSIQDLVVKTLTCDLRHWKPNDLVALKGLLSAQPPLPSFSQSLDMEQKYFLGWFRNQLDVARQTHQPLPKEIATLVPPDTSFEAVEAEYARIQRDYLQLREFQSLPLPASFDQSKAYIESRNAKPLFANDSSFVAFSLLERSLRADIRIQLLITAIAIRLRGPDAVNEIPDPYTGKPFKYESQDEGFTLTSGFSPEDQPLSMSFTF